MKPYILFKLVSLSPCACLRLAKSMSAISGDLWRSLEISGDSGGSGFEQGTSSRQRDSQSEGSCSSSSVWKWMPFGSSCLDGHTNLSGKIEEIHRLCSGFSHLTNCQTPLALACWACCPFSDFSCLFLTLLSGHFPLRLLLEWLSTCKRDAVLKPQSRGLE